MAKEIVRHTIQNIKGLPRNKAVTTLALLGGATFAIAACGGQGSDAATPTPVPGHFNTLRSPQVDVTGTIKKGGEPVVLRTAEEDAKERESIIAEAIAASKAQQPEPTPAPTATRVPDAVPTATPYPTPQSPEVGAMDIGIIYDPYAKNCQLVDRRTGAIINPANPEREWYPTGKGVKQDMLVTLNPGQIAVIEGYEVDGRKGVYRIRENNSNQASSYLTSILDGGVAKYNTRRDATIALCKTIQVASQNNWARDNIEIPGWMIDATSRSTESSTSYAPPTPAAPRPGEISGLSFGINYDSSTGICNILDKRTHAIVTNLQAPTYLDRKTTEEGEENDKLLSVILEPGQFALTEGWLVDKDREQPKKRFAFGTVAYVVDEAGSQKRQVEYFV